MQCSEGNGEIERGVLFSLRCLMLLSLLLEFGCFGGLLHGCVVGPRLFAPLVSRRQRS